MVRQAEKHDSSVPYSGSRSDVDLEVLADDPSSSRIQVQCTVCERRFTVGRNSLRNERMLARNAHCPDPSHPSSSTTLGMPSTAADGVEPPPSTHGAGSAQSSVIVPGTGEGRRYLNDYCKVNDWILSVHRQLSSDGMPMVYAKTIDQQLKLLGREEPQAMGYPQVIYSTGSKVELVCALKRCKAQLQQEKQSKERITRYQLQEDRDWRERVAAFNLLCDPKRCPRIEDCTTENLEKCLFLLTDAFPIDEDQPIFDEDGTFVGWKPRPGSHVPSHYISSAGHHGSPSSQCIMDDHPPGSWDSPANLLPVLVDIVSKDSRSHRKECIFQLRSGELVKTWVPLETECLLTRRVFPQLEALMAKPILSIPFYKDDPIPPPQRVEAKVDHVPLLTNNSACLMLTHKERAEESSALGQFGLTANETRMPPSTHDDGGAERRLELKCDILQAKAREHLEVLTVAKPDDSMLTPEAWAECNARLEKGNLETHVLKVMKHIRKLKLRARPRKLPNFETASVEDLEAYERVNALHQRIVMLHARQGDSGGAVNLDGMSLEKLEGYWAKVTS